MPLSQRICRFDDLSDPGARSFRVGVGDWPLRAFVVRQGAVVRAYVNRCPHAGHPLDLRPDHFLTPDGQAIICSSHAAQFDLLRGLCLTGPCLGRSLQSVPVEIEEDWVVLASAFQMQDYDP